MQQNQPLLEEQEGRSENVEVRVEAHNDVNNNVAAGEDAAAGAAGAAAEYEIACVIPEVPATCCSTQWLHSRHWRPVMLQHMLRLPLMTTPAFLSDRSNQWIAFLDAVNGRIVAPRMSMLETRITSINNVKWLVLVTACLCIVIPMILVLPLVVLVVFSVRRIAAEQNQLLVEADTALQQCSADFEQQKSLLLAQHGLPDLDIHLSFVDWTPAPVWRQACALSRFLVNPGEPKVPLWFPTGPLASAGLKLCLNNSYLEEEVEGEGVRRQVSPAAPVEPLAPLQQPILRIVQPSAPVAPVQSVNPYQQYSYPPGAGYHGQAQQLPPAPGQAFVGQAPGPYTGNGVGSSSTSVN
ncbi:MAG: hypothetical protein MHM6MM_006189 [Cercozoa sp. M6MM]